MKNKISNALWGIFWVSLGVIIAGNAFHWWDISLFFSGWWTLFIIVPCGIGMISNGFGSFSTVGFAVGILMLLNCQGIIVGATFRKLLIPVILILIGICIIVRNLINGAINVKTQYGEEACYAATFSSNRVIFPNQKFNGAETDSIFGGVTLDLRNAIIDENVIINATSVFGGTEIYLPPYVKVKINSTSFFGGASNKTKHQVQDGAPVVYVNVLCMFGGVDIR